MSTKINQDLTQREFEIETSINSDYHSRNHIYFEDVFKVQDYMCEQIYKAHKELVKIEEIIKTLRAQLRDPSFVNNFIYEKLEIQTFRKEKLIQDTRKLFDNLSPDMFFQYLKEIYENTKSAAGTGTMSAFFEKLESESA